MPLNVRRFGASCLVFLLLAGAVFAQMTGASGSQDIQQRLARARAYVAVRSYGAAAFELEKIRKESGDSSVQNIALMLLMNCYLESGDYRRTQELLNESYDLLKTTKGAASSSYFTVSGQVVKMARGQMERYKQLGLNVADPNMPVEVSAELEKMRGTLELVVNQAKELSDGNKRSSEAFGLLEEVTNVRSVMSRDAYDSTRWKNEVADARERLSNSQATVVNVDEPVNDAASIAQNNNTVAAANTLPVFNKISTAQLPPANDTSKPALNTETGSAQPAPAPQEVAKEIKNDTSTVAQKNTAPAASPETAKLNEEKPVQARPRTSDDKAAGGEKLPAANSNSTAAIGSLVEMATKKVAPVYPPMAKNMRVAGIVRVDVVLDEQGSVLSAQAQGPEVLKRAAMDAVKQWKFKPIVKDGQPTKASGFINFNFSL
jgi:TonB family protein